ncbi:MAG: winged helix-turn-helix domain-containing protein [Candidatus Eremiobacteraeota bacterium]|nr:winged helix-turn-helix domain-containing protein [Candidatus Eremiobacteraeota bacterium]
MIRSRSTYLFGPFRLDTTRRILYSGSVPTPIPERLFQILLALVQANGSVVARETLAQQVWGDAGVTDTNVNQHIYLLRLLLGERRGERSYIITIPGEGYRFAAPVSVAPEDEEQLVENAVRSAERVFDVGNDLFSFYCRGSYLLERRTAVAFRAAADAFEEALRIDPDYVPALIGLARAHTLLATYWHVSPQTAFPKARAAIDRALRRDPRSSMAHAVLSGIQLFFDWDWARSKRSMLTALTLNPQSTIVRTVAAWYYVCRNDMEKALSEARQALVVEPASLTLQLLMARVLVHSGDYRRAIGEMTNILAADAQFYAARRYRAQAYILAGDPQAAIDDLQPQPSDPEEDLSFRLPLMARAYAQLGDPRAREIYEQLRSRSKTEYITHWNVGLVAAALDRRDEAVHELQSALRERESTLLLLRTLPWFEPVMRRPEVRKILREVGP